MDLSKLILTWENIQCDSRRHITLRTQKCITTFHSLFVPFSTQIMPSEYEVLYFKRKNKVHKGKGVSKLDGILVLENGHAKLYDGCSTGQPPFYSSYSSLNFNREIQVDEELDFGVYHVEVVRAIKNNQSTENDQILIPKSSLKNSIRKPFMSKIRNNVTELSKDLLQSQKTASSSKRPLCNPASEGIENEQIGSLFNRQPFGKKLTSDRSTRSIDTKTMIISDSKQKYSSDYSSILVKDAALTLPNSIQRAIKPHQQDGVRFLWNAITGASESFQRISQLAGLNSVPKGAILADSMGTGKCEKFSPSALLIELKSTSQTRKNIHHNIPDSRSLSSKQATSLYSHCSIFSH
jgi:hypothetical protein